MSTNRIVVLLTPIFVGLSAALASWIADHFPGAPNLDTTELTAVMVLAAASALTAAAQWLHGWQKHEAKQAVIDAATDAASAEADAMETAVESGEAAPHTPRKPRAKGA